MDMGTQPPAELLELAELLAMTPASGSPASDTEARVARSWVDARLMGLLLAFARRLALSSALALPSALALVPVGVAGCRVARSLRPANDDALASNLEVDVLASGAVPTVASAAEVSLAPEPAVASPDASLGRSQLVQLATGSDTASKAEAA
jgi:hypothetical protein